MTREEVMTLGVDLYIPGVGLGADYQAEADFRVTFIEDTPRVSTWGQSFPGERTVEVELIECPLGNKRFGRGELAEIVGEESVKRIEQQAEDGLQ